MNETWIKRLLLVSAAWNITGGLTSLADPANHLAQMYTVAPTVVADPLLMYFYQCTWINVLAWAGAYALAAFWPQSRAAVLVAGGAGKAVYFLACAALVASGVGKPLVLAFGLGDLLMAALFGWAWLSQRPKPLPSSSSSTRTSGTPSRCSATASPH
ncbi:MAG: hypothetical protein QM722_11730 [Piscinibacter sp.]